MINILISGALGRMGENVKKASTLNDKVKVVCGVDRFSNFDDKNFPVYDDINKVNEKIDVIIDFSSPKALDKILEFSIKNNCSAVLCTTAYTPEDIEKINEASKKIAIFRSANMSLGINALLEVVTSVTKILTGFDVEIIEKHHNKKVDAPSGTALMLANAVKQADHNKYFTYGREGVVGQREANEIGIHAVRGGTIVGEHDVIFAGEDEVITISHQATDRKVFANGAIKAAQFIYNKPAGIYNMTDVIKESL